MPTGRVKMGILSEKSTDVSVRNNIKLEPYCNFNSLSHSSVVIHLFFFCSTGASFSEYVQSQALPFYLLSGTHNVSPCMHSGVFNSSFRHPYSHSLSAFSLQLQLYSISHKSDFRTPWIFMVCLLHMQHMHTDTQSHTYSTVVRDTQKICTIASIQHWYLTYLTYLTWSR